MNKPVDKKNKSLLNEIGHGNLIAKKGEQVWNWSTAAGKIRLKRRCDIFKRFIGNEGKIILELGCGTGLLTREIAKTRNKIYAIDISNNLLFKAKKRIHSKNVKFKLEDAHQTTFKDSYFDYIVGNSILHHLDVDLVIEEIYRLLKKAGEFIFIEPNMLNPQIAMERNIPIVRKLANNSPDETAFIKWSLKRKLIQAGFRNVKIEPFDFLHPLTPSFLIDIINLVSRLLEETPLIKEVAGSLIITGRKI